MRTRFLVLAAILAAGVLGFGSSAPSPAEAAGPGTWTAAADINISFAYHQAVLLPSGRVLLAAGPEAAPSTPDAARYNPATNSWSVTGATSDSHEYGSLTLLKDGRVLIAAGITSSGTSLTTSERWSPLTNLWAPAASMSVARYRHTATLLIDGRVLVAGGRDAWYNGADTSSAEIYDPVANVWTPATNMNTARARHAATLLADGRVLVVGGSNRTSDTPDSATDTSIDSAEIYDPASNTWTNTPDMTAPRELPANTLLSDGRVLVTGGYDLATNTPQGSEIYDPATDAWSPTGPMITNRSQHSATLLGNSKVLVAGGGFSAGDQSEVYDPITNAWTNTGTLPELHGAHTATLLHDGRVLVAGSLFFGGDTKATLYDATSWRLVAPPSLIAETLSPGLLWNEKVLFFDANQPDTYDADTDTWAAAGTGFTPAFDGISMGLVLKNGDAISIEGTRLQRYSRTTNSWSIGPTLLGPDMAHGGVLLMGGKVLITSPDGTSELYDPATNTTAATGSFSIDNFTDLVTLVDGRVLAAGGLVGGLDSAASALVYAPDTGMWSSVADMPQARIGGAGARLADGRVLVSGGDYWHLSSPPIQAYTVANAEIFSPISNTWTVVPSMLHARTGHKLILLPDNRVLAIGGCEQEPPPSLGCNRVLEAEVFSPSTNTWTSAGLMNHGRGNAGAILLTDGNVLVAGGGYVSTEIYDLAIGTDTDGDGYNNGLELALGQHPWSHCKTMRADLTGDGFVNSGDQGKLASKFGVRPPPSRVDQNGDKILNSGDQGLMASVFNKSVLMCL